MVVYCFFVTPGLSVRKVQEKRELLNSHLCDGVVCFLDTEYCYYIDVEKELTPDQEAKLLWIITPTFTGERTEKSTLVARSKSSNSLLVEIGPRLNFPTAFSISAVSICNTADIPATRMERSIRYLVTFSKECDPNDRDMVVNLLHDKMTELRYPEPLQSFEIAHEIEPWGEVEELDNCTQALAEVSEVLGLAFDECHLKYYTELFLERWKKYNNHRVF